MVSSALVDDLFLAVKRTNPSADSAVFLSGFFDIITYTILLNEHVN